MAGNVNLKSERNDDRALSYAERRHSRTCRRRPPSSPSPTDHHTTSKSEHVTHSISTSSCQVWPPNDRKGPPKLDLQEAEALISKGAPIFKTFTFQTRNLPFRHSRYYAFAGMNDGKTSLEALSKVSQLTEGMSQALTGPVKNLFPWETLEQPSLTDCFGTLPGTITLNYWVGLVGQPLSPGETDSTIMLRGMDLSDIVDRLSYLQDYGLSLDAESMTDFLYARLLYHPERHTVDVYDMDTQIAALTDVLDTRYFIDFSEAKFQIMAAHYYSKDPEDVHHFFHQLLLSLELHLRIECEVYNNIDKDRMRLRLPVRVAWSVAVAKIWTSSVSIDYTGYESCWSLHESFEVVARNKRSRIRQLEKLGWTLKWPNMAAVTEILDNEFKGAAILESRSFEARSWLSGVVLPGFSSSWLSIKCLIDCDLESGKKLSGLSEMNPQTGFQYVNGTYWYSSSIVGKVLGAASGVNQDAGWLGPCHYASQLERVQCIRVHERPPLERMCKQRTKDMTARSEPLGPVDDYYPVDEFVMVLPKHTIVDTIRVEKLAFKLRAHPENCSSDQPSLYQVAVVFAAEGQTYHLRLRHNTTFIKAVACQGPHVLFWDYTYKSIRVDGLLDLQYWGGMYAKAPYVITSCTFSGSHNISGSDNRNYFDEESVLLVEAFGVADNEVFARAWCAYMGLSAIVSNINETCMACSIREAYAACVSVVICTEGRKDEGVEAVKSSPPRPRHRHGRKPAL